MSPRWSRKGFGSIKPSRLPFECQHGDTAHKVSLPGWSQAPSSVQTDTTNPIALPDLRDLNSNILACSQLGWWHCVFRSFLPWLQAPCFICCLQMIVSGLGLTRGTAALWERACAYPCRVSYTLFLAAWGFFGTNRHSISTSLYFSIKLLL